MHRSMSTEEGRAYSRLALLYCLATSPAAAENALEKSNPSVHPKCTQNIEALASRVGH